MRVITGKYKGRRFDVPRTFKARPTTDCAKENIFNVLRAYIDFDSIRALDLFGGTGSISLELLSRGCSQVTTLEYNRQHFLFIRKTMRELADPASQVLHGDALRYIPRCHEQFDFVFADPPYTLPELPTLPRLILDSETLRPGGLLVFEHGKRNNFEDMPEFIEHRAYGSVNFSIFRKV